MRRKNEPRMLAGQYYVPSVVGGVSGVDHAGTDRLQTRPTLSRVFAEPVARRSMACLTHGNHRRSADRRSIGSLPRLRPPVCLRTASVQRVRAVIGTLYRRGVRRQRTPVCARSAVLTMCWLPFLFARSAVPRGLLGD